MELPALPLLAPWYRVVADGERLLLEHAQSLVVLEGAAVKALLPALLPLLDGTRGVDELVERLGRPARPAVVAALEVLAARSVVVEGPDVSRPARPAGARSAAAAFGLSPAAAEERLAGAAVGVVGGGAAAIEVARLLHGAGIGRVRLAGWNGRGRFDLRVVAPAPDELDRLARWNRCALRSGARWLLVRPFDGRAALVGPLVVPDETCCYACLLLRRAACSGYADELPELEEAPLAAAADPGLEALAVAVAAHLVVRWVAGGDTTIAGTLLSVEPYPVLRFEESAVLRVPRCPVCSPPARAASPLPWHEAKAGERGERAA